MGQDSYSASITTKRAGKPVDFNAQRNGDIVTARNEKAAAIMPGRFVVQGTADDEVKIDDGGVTGETFIGLAVDIETRERSGTNTYTAGFAQNELLPVAKSGRWYAECEEAVDKGGTVYVRFAEGTGAVIGKCRSDADAVGGDGEDEATADAIKATFAETISGAGIVAVELSMNQATQIIPEAEVVESGGT